MTTITLFDGSIADVTTSLAIFVERDLGNDALPIVPVVDGLRLGLPIEVAERLAKAGDRIEKALFKSREAPKEAAVFLPLQDRLP